MVSAVIEIRIEDEQKTDSMIQHLVKNGMDPIVIEILNKDFLVEIQEYHGEVLLSSLPEAGEELTEFKQLGELMMDEEISFQHSPAEFVIEDKEFIKLSNKLMEL